MNTIHELLKSNSDKGNNLAFKLIKEHSWYYKVDLIATALSKIAILALAIVFGAYLIIRMI